MGNDQVRGYRFTVHGWKGNKVICFVGAAFQLQLELMAEVLSTVPK